MTGVIFSDLGKAASFMALDWVQEALRNSLGFSPFPATLNLRPRAKEDAQVWEKIQEELQDVELPPSSAGFCSARLYRIEIHGPADRSRATIKGAVLRPGVSGYPKDKIEIVAPVRLKDVLGVQDGDALTLEFVL